MVVADTISGLTGGIKAREQREFPVLTNSPGDVQAVDPGHVL